MGLEVHVTIPSIFLHVLCHPRTFSVLQSASMDLLSTLHPKIHFLISRAVFVPRPVAH